MRWLLMAVTLLAAGCGFHLKGSHALPDELRTLSLSSFDRYARATVLVREQLERGGATLGASGPQVHLIRDKLDRQTLSLFASGQVAEYELIYTLDWQLIRPEAEPLDFQVEVRRDYQDDPTRTLAKDRERQLLLEEMRREAASRLLAQLSQQGR
ncbi:LPS assembly lipoprotein LptE [Gallaecimonas sp. GXIMD4217]|uniref:LPS-assembly lipoprotein LptE n=1 Tax=Gallaecimonas sp. GXIMD4217 TaxID=3131927 RepID=UPI00311AE5B4